MWSPAYKYQHYKSNRERPSKRKLRSASYRYQVLTATSRSPVFLNVYGGEFSPFFIGTNNGRDTDVDDKQLLAIKPSSSPSSRYYYPFRFTKTEVAHDGCTILCQATECFRLGIHRCAACERASYCSEDCRLRDRDRHLDVCREHTTEKRIQLMMDFQKYKMMTTSAHDGGSGSGCCCRGNPKCFNSVVSFCPHCQATVCDKWECSKYHLDHCHQYLLDTTLLEQEWVMVESPDEWVVIERVTLVKLRDCASVHDALKRLKNE